MCERSVCTLCHNDNGYHSNAASVQLIWEPQQAASTRVCPELNMKPSQLVFVDVQITELNSDEGCSDSDCKIKEDVSCCVTALDGFDLHTPVTDSHLRRFWVPSCDR